MEHKQTEIIEIMYQAKKKGMTFFLEGTELKFKIKKGFALDKTFLPVLKKHKQGLIAFLQAQEAKNKQKLIPQIKKIDRSSTQEFGLSYAQERLWFIDKLQGSSSYHISGVLRLKGVLEISMLEAALRQIVARHESLRTIFTEIEGEPYQKVISADDFQLDKAEISTDIVEKSIDTALTTPFDLGSDYMLRAHLLPIAAEEHILVLVLHHIASDGWSIPIIVKELEVYYTAAISNTKAVIPELPIQYIDYSLWQKEYLSGTVLEEKLAYWEQQLSNNTPLAIPTDYVRPAIQDTRGANHQFSIDATTTAALKKVSQENGSTLFMSLMSVYAILLYRYSGENDITIGSPIANREQAELSGLVGFFVNMIAIRSQVEGTQSFESLLQQVKETTVSAYQHQDVPFEKIVDRIVSERDQSKTPVFQTMLTLQNNEAVGEVTLGQSQIEILPTKTTTSKFDLSLEISESSQGLIVNIEYSQGLFKSESIERLGAHFQYLVAAILNNPKEKIDQLAILSEAEKAQIAGFNATTTAYPEVGNLLEEFTKQVASRPEATAVVFEGESLSFEVLDQKTNQLANYLRKQGVTKETLVPISVERSFEMLIGILGILKAGGAYVPIDPMFPADRIGYILEDTAAKIVLTQERFATHFEDKEIQVITLDMLTLDEESKEFEVAAIAPEQLAYVIYTSGTTGRPKGVLCEHQGLRNRLKWMQDDLAITTKDIIIQKTTYTFDVSVWELTMPLVTGCKLVFAKPEGHKDPLYLQELIAKEQGTIMHFVPSMLSIFLEDVDSKLCTSLRHVVCSGEALTNSMVKSFRTQLPTIQIHNLYGPTEAAIDVTSIDLTTAEIENQVSIGYPVANTQIYILNDALEPQPIGVAGELCIGGIQVARGYLNREDLTKEKFIEDPFSSGGRLYKTGDLASWNADGSIAYIGRKDNQVKLRGYRIELGEIETLLEEQDTVQQAVVVAKEITSGNKQLVAYVVNEGVFEEQAAMEQLSMLLPEYMVPKYYVSLTEMPLSGNGKVDRKRLPSPAVGNSNQEAYVAPATDTEKALAAIWQELLGVAQVGKNDNFFEIGGHSLLAVKLVSRIRTAFEKQLNVKDIFQYPRLEHLANWIEHEGNREIETITVSERPERIPLSFTQERLWFIDRLQGSTAYHIPAILRIKGTLDTDALAKAIQLLVDRHESLRTFIQTEEGKGYQYIQTAKAYTTSFNVGTQEETYIKEIIEQPFDLSKDYMLRSGILELKKEEHLLVLVLHHIASDGWSIPIFVKELEAAYQSIKNNKALTLTPLAVQYADYSIWQREYLSGDRLAQKIAYWEQQLKGVTPLAIPTDYKRPIALQNRGAAHSFTISKEQTQQLKQMSQEQGTTLFMTLLTLYKVLLYRYSGERDITVGSPIANREQPEIEGLIGFFVNTIALRSQIEGTQSFFELVQQVKKTTLEAYAHQDVPFEKIVDRVVKHRDQSQSPIFQTLFTVQNNEAVEGLQLGESEITMVTPESNTAKFELSVSVTEQIDHLEVTLEYNTQLFVAKTIEHLGVHFEQLIDAVIAQPNAEIGRLAMLSQNEINQLNEFSFEALEYDTSKTIIDVFEAQTNKQPEAIALVFEEKEITYRELEEHSNQIANYLIAKGVEQETFVPLCMERSLEAVFCIFGILKAGAVYVPIDPKLPQERIQYILEDTAASLAITTTAYQAIVESKDCRTIVFEDITETLKNTPSTKVNRIVSPEQLAYVIYTSGTTGKPKGVMIQYKSLQALLEGMNRRYPVTDSDRLLLKTTFTFDVSIYELFGWIHQGGSLGILPEGGTTDIPLLIDTIATQKITHFNLVPSLFSVFIEELEQIGIEKARDLKYVMLAGEKLPMELILNYRKLGLKASLENIYGPTEATIYSSYFDTTPLATETVHVPIGKPVDNVELLILNEQGEQQPLGITGELCIGGQQLAKGYLNRAELTAEKFVAHPFKQGAKLYRTGDLTRWLPDGAIEYIGRKDAQVKIRGYRIELGEIEAALESIQEVEQAIVIVKENEIGTKRLLAYVVGQVVKDVQILQQQLGEKLPSYMQPSQYVILEEFPLNHSGKVDRKQLPEPEYYIDETAYIAPKNEIEEKLAALWCELLNLEQVSTTSNFFELGGHSILAVRMVARIKSDFAIPIHIKTVFEKDTIQKLAIYIEQQETGTAAAVVRIDRSQRIPLSFMQERLWFLDQLQGSIAYHIPGVLKIKGTLAISKLEQALKQVMARHEVLRTIYIEDENGVYQQIQTVQDFKLEQQAVTDNQLTSTIEEVIAKPFDLALDYMLRATVLQLNETTNVLVLVAHHIAADGWSLPIVIKELEAFINEKEAYLSPLNIQYADYSAWQRNYLDATQLSQKIDYWKTQLEGNTALSLPVDYSRSKLLTNKGANHTFTIDTKTTQALKDFGQGQQATLYMTLLTIYKVLLYRYSGEKDITVGSPIANREQEEVAGLIGFFVNTIAVRNQIEGTQTFDELLRSVKATILDAYAHQEVPFEKIVEQVVTTRDRGRTPIFQTLFTLQNNEQVERIQFGTHEVEVIATQNATAKYELSCTVIEIDGALAIQLNYNTALFKKSTIERLGVHFESLLNSVLNSPEKAIDALPMVTKAEMQQLLNFSSSVTTKVTEETTFVAQFTAKAIAQPNVIAVEALGKQLTYQELDERSNQVAHALKAEGITKGSLVPICIDRSVDMMVGLLGILKAGAAYVPIDPKFPQQRIDYMLNDTGAKVVVTMSKYEAYFNKDIVCLSITQEALKTVSKEPVTIQIDPEDTIYIIYTSGTTGNPKGTMISHRAITDYCHGIISNTNIAAGKRFGLVSSIAADLGNTILFSAFVCGGTLCIFDEDEIMNVKALQRAKLDSLKIVPSHWKALQEGGEILLPKHSLIFGGEALSQDIIERIREANKACKVYNHYGPTEATIGKLLKPIDTKSNHITLGKPFCSDDVYVLNEALELVPTGVIGELCISGIGLAKGYLNLPELTKEKFIANPYQSNAMLYKTGDLVKWTTDGEIEFIGRKDHQLKIRGFRVELGEIESALVSHESVEQAVVLTDADQKRLIAYVISSNSITQNELQEALQTRLPEYMIPSAFVFMDQFPMLANGKVNRKQLATQVVASVTENVTYVAPITEIEKQLATIWSEVLTHEKVGTHSNFFELGGHSLLAIRLIAKMNTALQQEFVVSQLFQFPTIKGFIANVIDNNEGSIATTITLMNTDKQQEKSLFCIPGAGGNIVSFYALAQGIEGAYKVYGCKAQGLENDAPILETVEAIATQYIKEIQEIDPQGPYHLAGYSFGSKVVYEMAYQLQNQGFEVAQLVIFDGEPYADVVTTVSEEYSRETHLLEMYQLIAAYYQQEEVKPIEATLLKGKTFEEQMDIVYDQIQEQNMAYINRTVFKRFIALHIKHTHAAQTYDPKYKELIKAIPIQLYQTAQNETLELTNRWYQASKLLPIAIQVEGAHLSMLQEPFVQQIITHLKEQETVLHP